MTKSIKYILCALTFFLCHLISVGQQNHIDSLINIIQTEKEDTLKLIHLFQVSDECETIGNYPDGLKYGEMGLVLANIILKNNPDSVVKKITEKYSAKIYGNNGIIFSDQGNYPEALRNHLASLKIREKLKEDKGIASSYGNIGNIYFFQKNYSFALDNFFKCLKIEEKIEDEYGIARCYIGIGNVYLDQSKYNDALNNYFSALKIGQKIGDKKGVADLHNNIGSVYTHQQKHPMALTNYQESLKIYEELEDIAGVITTYLNIGVVLMDQKKTLQSESYLIKAKDLSKKIGHKEYLRDSHKLLTDLYSAKNDYKGAYENHKMYILYRDSLDNEETRKKTIQSQMTYDFEKKEAVATAEHKKELENQNALAEEKSRKQKIVLFLILGSLLLVLIFAGFIFRSLRITRKQKNIIEEQKNIVEQQKKEVEQQKNIVEEHQKEIIDSITYARRIQQSLLPSEKYIEKNLNRLKKRS